MDPKGVQLALVANVKSISINLKCFTIIPNSNIIKKHYCFY